MNDKDMQEWLREGLENNNPDICRGCEHLQTDGCLMGCCHDYTKEGAKC
jgi:hypothetical protein